MGKDRLKRLLIVLLLVGFLAIGVKVFADWQEKKRAQGEVLSLPTAEIGKKITNVGEQILGKTVEVLPLNQELKEKVISTETISSGSQEENATQTERVEIKTQEIIEIVKELPADQLENIKKQVFKDFCQKILEEDGGD